MILQTSWALNFTKNIFPIFKINWWRLVPTRHIADAYMVSKVTYFHLLAAHPNSPLSSQYSNDNHTLPSWELNYVHHSEPPGVVCRGCCLLQVPAGTELSTHWPRLLCWRSGRAQRTADYDSHCWTVRGLIMESVGPGPRYYNYLQYNTYYQLFSSTPDTDHKQPN